MNAHAHAYYIHKHAYESVHSYTESARITPSPHVLYMGLGRMSLFDMRASAVYVMDLALDEINDTRLHI